MELERPKPNRTPAQFEPNRSQQNFQADPTARRGQGPYTQPPKAAKPKGKWLPALAVAVALGIGAFGAYHYLGGQGDMTSLSSPVVHAQQTLTVSGADVDEATTAAAVAAINSGQNNNPLIANLTQQEKQEIVSGQRKFYKLPVVPPQSHVPTAPSAPPPTQTASNLPPGPVQHRVHHARPLPSSIPQQQTDQPLASAPPADVPQDRIQITLDGALYGSYNITNSPFTLDAPLKLGDRFTVTCLELSSGKTSVTVGIGTVLNPVQTELAQGQSANFSVVPHGTGQDYSWFENQANNGNPVAEYGLGHMYQYGIGVPQDTSQAIHWYQQAANQNYLDAKQRLAELGQ